MAVPTNNLNNLATPTIMIDNTVLPIVPNSSKFTEGFGEQKVSTQSSGGGQVDIIVSQDVSTSFSKFMCQVVNTSANIQFLRNIKSGGGSVRHVISFFDNDVGFIRTITQAVLTNDYEVGMGSDTPIDIEFSGAPAV